MTAAHCIYIKKRADRSEEKEAKWQVKPEAGSTQMWDFNKIGLRAAINPQNREKDFIWTHFRHSEIGAAKKGLDLPQVKVIDCLWNRLRPTTQLLI